MNDLENLKRSEYQASDHKKHSKNIRKNKTKSIITVVVVILFFLVAIMIFIGKLPISFSRTNTALSQYTSVMEASCNNQNPKIVDVAMLGAHHAFTDEITINSPIAPNLDDFILNNGVANLFFDGLVARYKRCQSSTTAKLLNKGVRYFDLETVYVDDAFYAANQLISNKIDQHVIDIISFLQTNPKEYVIIDFRKIDYNGSSISELYKYLEKIKNLEQSLFDFVHYDSTSNQLAELRYNDVVDEGGIVLLLDDEISMQYNRHYNRKVSVEEVENNYTSNNETIKAINEQVEKYKTPQTTFRINNAYLSSDINIKTLINWSTTDMAEWFNSTITNQENLTEWFAAMPILSVNFADSGKGNFNDAIVRFIIQYNEKEEII